MEAFLHFCVKLLPKPLRRLYDRFEELIVYIYYGVLTTILNLVVQFAAQFGLDMVNMSALEFTLFGNTVTQANIKTFLATSIAWLVAVFFAFYVNKKYVFRSVTTSKAQLAREMGTFISARIASYFMEVGIMQLGVPLYSDGVDVTNIWVYAIFKFTAQVVVTLANYFFSKIFVFRKQKNTDSASED
jgi:putative flippase GtrA